MNLKNYLKIKKIALKSFANSISVSAVTVSRYINGSRLPKKEVINKIYELTNGAVTADDFYLDIEKEKLFIQKEKFFIENLIKNIKGNSRQHLAKAITLIESKNIQDQINSEKLVNSLIPSRKSIRIGISGVPGVGKSTFIEAIGLLLIKKGFKVSVLAIDPSSQKTGGSILGDKTRMEKLSINNKAFIRPSPSSGHLGGVTKSTRESILCLETAGYEIIFIETMGVGQAETAVYNMVDIFLVLLLPAGGDDLQGIKKGIIELADLIVVNKADKILSSVAEMTVNDYQNAISIIRSSRKDWKPKVLKCSSKNSLGISEIWNQIKEFKKKRIKSMSFFENRKIQNTNWLWETIMKKFIDFFDDEIKKNDLVVEIEKNVLENKININDAANLILEIYLKKFK